MYNTVSSRMFLFGFEFLLKVQVSCFQRWVFIAALYR